MLLDTPAKNSGADMKSTGIKSKYKKLGQHETEDLQSRGENKSERAGIQMEKYLQIIYISVGLCLKQSNSGNFFTAKYIYIDFKIDN